MEGKRRRVGPAGREKKSEPRAHAARRANRRLASDLTASTRARRVQWQKIIEVVGRGIFLFRAKIQSVSYTERVTKQAASGKKKNRDENGELSFHREGYLSEGDCAVNAAEAFSRSTGPPARKRTIYIFAAAGSFTLPGPPEISPPP